MTDSGDSKVRRKPSIFALGTAAVLVIVAVVVFGLLRSSDLQSVSATTDGSDAQASPSQSPNQPAETTDPAQAPADPESAPAAPADPTTPRATSSTGAELTVDSASAIPAYEEVPINESVTVVGTVSASVVQTTPTHSDGTGAGEVDGPALAVTVEVRNDSAQQVNLGDVGVTMTIGPDRIPASSLPTQSLSDPFSGELAPGQSAQATYVFLVPEGSAQDIRIEVAVGGAQPLLVFAGARP